MVLQGYPFKLVRLSKVLQKNKEYRIYKPMLIFSEYETF